MHSFLLFLERHGIHTFLAATFYAAVPEPERLALRAARIVRDTVPATTLPCGESDCARAVVESRRGRLTAVCTREPPACVAVDVTRADLDQIALSLDPLLEVVRRIARAEPADRHSRTPDAILAGVQRGDSAKARDVWLALRPWAPRFRTWLASLDRAPRPSLVLVPTDATLDADITARHGAGAYVELDALSASWALRNGRIAGVRRLRVAAPPPDDEDDAPSHARAPRSLSDDAARTRARSHASPTPRPPRATRWRDVDIFLVDATTVLVRVGDRTQRLTHTDLGLASNRNRKPKKTWELLVVLCAGAGTFKWRRFGTFANASKIVSDLRREMSRAFGIKDDPFESFSYTEQWRTKFRAHPRLPGQLRDEDDAGENDSA